MNRPAINRRAIRAALVITGAVCFAVAALATFDWVGGGRLNVTGLALAGFACWVASTLS